jgi:transposase-like protein
MEQFQNQRRIRHMSKLTSKQPNQQQAGDPLTELIRQGARDLIAQAIQAELNQLLDQFDHLTEDGKRAVIRNGYLPERTIQTGVGDVEVRVPKVRDRSGGGVKFNSNLIPPYLRRTKNIEELLPWLYLKGVSTGDFSEALEALLGPQARGLSTATIGRLKKVWVKEHAQWSQRDLSDKEYVYWWVDGIYFNIRGDNDRECMLIIIGATPEGHKELAAVEDGLRESEQSWTELLQDLRSRGLKVAPKLAVGDGALGFWKALNKAYPSTRHQRCWVHKTANILNKVPKAQRAKVKAALHEIWMAATREEAYEAFESFIARFGGKYPKAQESLEKDKEELLAFYDFPAKHWVHLRTTNPIESTFSTVRLRTVKTRSCVSRSTILAMVFKLVQSAQQRWKRLKGYDQLGAVLQGLKFVNGIPVKEQEKVVPVEGVA